ncbi:MAG: RIP metalloprotease RseP [Pseudomonadota bacterium]
MGGSLGGYIIPFLFVLSIVVFFHELGHFMVARWCGVRVLTFSVGFGPELFGWNDKQGTRWKLAAIPLGGYVKFAGDENAASVPDHEILDRMTAAEKSGAFHLKPVSQRAAIVAAGPIANFILATVIFACIFSVVGQPIIQARVDTVNQDSAAAEAGFQPGDLVVSIEGKEISGFNDMQRIVSVSAERELSFVVERGGIDVELTATPRLREVTDRFGNAQRIGLLGISRSTEPEDVVVQRYNPLTATWMGVGEVYFIIDRTLSYIWGLVAGRESADQLGGPIRIAQMSGDVATLGIAPLFQLAAVLSVSIGLLNLFPVPMLDGGHLVYYAVEALRGKPLSEKTQEWGFKVGLALVLMLMVFATWNDITRLL